MKIDLDKPTSQRQFAMMVGRSREAISRAAAKGVLKQGATLGEWLQTYCTYLSEQAAGRRESGKRDLVEERARLACRQSERLEIELKLTRGQVMHVEPLALFIGGLFSTSRNKMLALPHRIKSLINYITPTDIDKIDDLVREVLSDLAESRIPPELTAKIDDLERELWAGERSHSNGAKEKGRLPDARAARPADAGRGTDVSAGKRKNDGNRVSPAAPE